MNRTLRSIALAFLASLAMTCAYAGTYTFQISTSFPAGNDGLATYMRNQNGVITGPSLLFFAVGNQGDIATRSALDFNITRMPDFEKVISATLQISPYIINVQNALLGPVGSINHLDASTPLPSNPLPTAPSDPRRFTWEALGAAPQVASLGFGGSCCNYNSYNVTAAVAADHLGGYNTSPFSLVENPLRHNALGYVQYDRGRLIVETSTPSPISYSVQNLGGTVFEATYTFSNEVSFPLGLIDIDFATNLYRESSIEVSLEGDATDWTGNLLNSGIEVPATVSFAKSSGGLQGGQRATGFKVRFDWLGGGTPGDQPFHVYDPSTFDEIYSGTTITAVPENSTWLFMVFGILVLLILARTTRLSCITDRHA